MAWVQTPWGYDAEGELEPLITTADFHELTDHRFAEDARIATAIAASSNAIRNWCGWHVAGSVACRATMDGGERRLWLPSNHVTAITSVTVMGDVTSDYQWNRLGLLRIPRTPDELQAVVVEYEAGYDSVPPEIAELVRDHVERAVSKSRGIAQETAGSVSISYAQSYAAALGGVSLTPTDREVLAPYRLVEAM